jgi:hypothetical protein
MFYFPFPSHLIFTVKYPAQGLNLSLIFLKATDFGGCFTPQRASSSGLPEWFRVTRKTACYLPKQIISAFYWQIKKDARTGNGIFNAQDASRQFTTLGRLECDPRIYEILQILSISLLDKTPIREILTKCDYNNFKEREDKQLIISGFLSAHS